MNLYKSLLLVLLVLSSACIDLPDIEYVEPEVEAPDAGGPSQSLDSGSSEPVTPDAGLTPDAGPGGTDAGDSGTIDAGVPDGGVPPTLSVSWGAPTETVFTNGTVTVSVSVTGGTPELVKLLLDGAPVATLTPPYTHPWDTRALPERTYSLVVRASTAGRAFNSPTRTVVVDRTPPQVVSRNPAPGAQAVSVRQVIQAVFSEPVRPGTVSPASVRLMSGASEVPSQRVLAADGVTLGVSANSPVSVPAVLALQLSADILDLAGNPLQVPSGVWSWSLPVFLPVGSALRVDPQATGASLPSIQIDAQGRPWVVWQERLSNAEAIRVARWTGNVWEAVGGALNSTAELLDNTAVPAFRFDDAGRPVVAWSDSQYINISRWSGTGAWTRIARLSASSGTPRAVSPVLEVDDQGRLVVAWSEGVEGSVPSIHVRRRDGDGNWEDLGSLDAYPGTSSFAGSPALQLNSTGAPVVAWVEQGDIIEESVHVRRWNGSAWEPYGEALSADGGRTEVRMATLRMDSNGRPVVAWVQAGKTYVRRWNGSTWAPLGDALHAEQDVQTTFFTALELNGAGSPVVASAAVVEGEVPAHLLVQRWDEGQWVSLGGPLSANPGRTSVDYTFSQALDRDGYPVLAWSEVDGSAFRVYVYAHNH
jgi:hypothetical protein